MLLALMGSVPFLIPHHLNPITSFFNEWVAVALGLLAAASLLLSPKGWQPLRVPLIALVPLSLALIAAIQVATGKSVYWQHHMLVGLYLVWAALMMVLGSNLKHEVGLERVAPVLALALLVAGSVSAILVGLQVAGVESAWIMETRGKTYPANLGQTNHLASLLGLALASLAYLGTSRRIPAWGVGTIGLTLLAALAMTGARSGWLYLTVLLVLAAYWRWRQPQAQGRWMLGAAAASLVLFAVLQLLLPMLLAGHAPVMPGEKVVAAAAGGSVRLQLLEVAWRSFLTSPWLGVGFGQFAWHDFLLAEVVPHNAGMATHAHNLFAQLLAETGVFGVSMVLAGIVFWLWKARVRALNPEHVWLLAVLGMLFTHSMLEYPLWYAYFLGVAGLLLGMDDETHVELRMELGPVVMAGFLVFGLFSLHNLAVHERKLEAWFALGNAGKIGPRQIDAFATDMLQVRTRSLLAPYADVASAIVLQTDRQDINAKVAVSSQAIRYTPTASLAYKHAALLAMNGQRNAALAQLHLALSRHPGMADAFHRHIFKQLLKGEIRMLPLLMTVQDQTKPASKLNLINSGKNPAPIRESRP